MPKYYDFMVCGYFLYFTSHCVIEAMHVHASDKRLTETGSAKFFVREDGSSSVQSRGILTDKQVNAIQAFIKVNYLDMYQKWAQYSQTGFSKK